MQFGNHEVIQNALHVDEVLKAIENSIDLFTELKALKINLI